MPVNTGIVLGGLQQQQQSDPIQKLAAFMQILQAQRQGQLTDLELEQKRQMNPLALDELRIKNEQHKVINNAINQRLNPPQADVGAAQAKNDSAFKNKLKFAETLALADPARGRAQLDALKLEYPELGEHQGILYNKRSGEVVATMPYGNAAGNVIQYQAPTQMGGQFSVTTPPGANSVLREQAAIREQEQARLQPFSIGPTSPTTPPTVRSRLDVLGGAVPNVSPQVPPNAAPSGISQQSGPQTPSLARIPPAVQQARDGDRLGILLRERESQQRAGRVDPALDAEIAQMQRGTVAAQAPRVGVPTGMSPEQESDVAARKESKVLDAKAASEMYSNMQKQSASAPAKIAKLERIQNLLKDYDGGKMAEAGFQLARFGTSLGIKIDPALPNKEAAVALSNEISLQLRNTGEGGGMPGALSDADREFLRTMAPQLGQTSDGRKQLIESHVKLMEREQKVARMANQYKMKHGVVDANFFTQLQDWTNRNPIYGGNK